MACAQGSSVPVTRFGDSGCSWVFLCIWEVLALLCLPSCPQDLGYAGVPIAEHALWAEVGGSIVFVVLWVLTGCSAQMRLEDLGWQFPLRVGMMLKMLASVRLPSLHGYDACMVFWANGALR